MQYRPTGQWLSAKTALVCTRCADPIFKRRRYFATPSNVYCAWCAHDVWGVTPRQKADQRLSAGDVAEIEAASEPWR